MSNESETVEAELDLIWGAAAIGKVIRKGRSATYHLLEQGRLPAKKVGEQWVSRRSELERALSAEIAA